MDTSDNSPGMLTDPFASSSGEVEARVGELLWDGAACTLSWPPSWKTDVLGEEEVGAAMLAAVAETGLGLLCEFIRTCIMFTAEAGTFAVDELTDLVVSRTGQDDVAAFSSSAGLLAFAGTAGLGWPTASCTTAALVDSACAPAKKLSNSNSSLLPSLWQAANASACCAVNGKLAVAWLAAAPLPGTRGAALPDMSESIDAAAGGRLRSRKKAKRVTRQQKLNKLRKWFQQKANIITKCEGWGDH